MRHGARDSQAIRLRYYNITLILLVDSHKALEMNHVIVGRLTSPKVEQRLYSLLRVGKSQSVEASRPGHHHSSVELAFAGLSLVIDQQLDEFKAHL